MEPQRDDIPDLQKEKEAVVPPLVSVVIPCYNQAHFLGEAIESVLAQSYPNFEIIVVDDGSTDDTSEVAGRYPKVRLVRQENQGLSGARNAGLARSEGEYVVFLDADDRLLPEALETGLEYLEARPECAFVNGHYRYITLDGSPFSTRTQPVVGDRHYAELLHNNYIAMHATVMYRQAVFESVGGFDTSLSACEDYDLYLRIARRFPICSHEEVVAEYRRHDANMSSNAVLMLGTSVSVLRSQRKHIRGHKQYEEAYKFGLKLWQGKYGDRLVDEVRAYLKERDWKGALGSALVLLRYYPWGITLLSERRMERRRLTRRLQARREELEACEQRLKELEADQEEPESAVLAKERQEVQQLRERVRKLERRMQNLSLRARIGRNGKVWSSLWSSLKKKVGHARAKVSRR